MLLDFAKRRSFSIQRWVEAACLADLVWVLLTYWKRLVFFACLGLVAAFVYSKWSPQEYVSRATVRFIPAQVSESYVTSNVAMQVDQRIFAVIQMLRSRLTATQMIERFALYPQLRRFYPVADLVEGFQEELRVATVAGDLGGDKRAVPSIEIRFRYGNAIKAQQVVQRIVELIYEENRRYRSDQSIGTTDFLQQEVKTATEQITELEEQLSGLPRPGGEAQGYEDLLKVENLHDLERRLTDLEHQMNYITLDRNLRRSGVTGLENRLRSLLDSAPNRVPVATQATERLREFVTGLEGKVAELQRRYRPGLEERVTAERQLEKAQHQLLEQIDVDKRTALNREVEDIETQLSRMRAELAGYEATLQRQAADEARLRQEVMSLRAEFAPQQDRENERLNLLREYTVAKEQYSNLMKRQRESEMASTMERRGQGETAEMVEPPTLPLEPEFPGTRAVWAIGTIAGAAVGYLLGLLSFLMRPMVRTAGHVAMLADVPVLAALPGTLTGTGDGMLWHRLIPLSILAMVLAGCAPSAQSIRDEAIGKGRGSLQKRDYAAAIIHFRRAVQADAKAGEAYWGLSEAYADSGQMTPAYQQLIRAAELLPNRVEIVERLADTSYQLYFADPGRPAAALREVEQLAATLQEKWPQRASGPRLMAQVLVERRHFTEAIALMESTLERMEDGSIRAQLASVYFQNGDKANAERHLRHCLAANPAFSPGYDLLYLQLMSERKLVEARQVLEAKTLAIKSLDTGLQLAAHDDATGERASVETQLAHLAQRWATAEDTDARIGDFWLHRSKWDAARYWYDSGRASHAGARSLYSGRLADLLMARKDVGAARALIASELKRYPKDTLMLAYDAVLKMDVASGEQERKHTQAQLESLVSRMPNSPFVRLHLGRAYLLNGDALKAAEQLQNSVALDPNYAPGWLALAEAELALGNANQAQAHLDAVLRRAPGYGPARMLRAQASMAEQKPAEAAKALGELVAAEPDNLDAMMLLARAKVALGLQGEAKQLLSNAAEKSPGDARLAVEEARISLRGGNAAEALQRLNRAQAAGAKGSEFEAMIASVALSAGDSQQAADRFRKLTDANPSNLEYRLGYASSLGMLGKRAEAEVQFQAVQQKAGRDARPWLLYGALMASTSNSQAERKAYEEALQRDPDNAFALNNLAFLLARTGVDIQKALTYAERARRQLPGNWEVNDTLAYVYVRLGLARNALATLEELSQNQRGPMLDHTRETIAQLRRGELAEVRRRMEQGVGEQN
jgi:tetratricopeptide (TPR) repeat protein